MTVFGGRMVRALAWIGIGGSVACVPPPEAGAPFNEALVLAYRSFDADDAELAAQLRNLERRIYQDLLVGDADVKARSVQPVGLTNDDVAHLEQRPPPPVDPANALAVATVHGSAHPVEAHASIPVLDDQRPLEPQSPTHYDRSFLEGQDCWETRGCSWLRTFQNLTKEYPLNLIPPITYDFFKDFRWVDMNAGGRASSNPRWAYLARSWNPDSYESENGRNVIYQSYTIEIWMPRDGEGFRWDAEEEVAADVDTALHGDSTGGGTLRLLSLWTETVVPLAGDDVELQTAVIRNGMQDNFNTHDDWLTEHWTE